VAANTRVVLEPTAERELQEAMQWYEIRQSGLGIELAIEVDRCIERIRQNPQLYARIKNDYRRAPVDRFPYAIYYEHVADAVVIYAIFHASRDPAKLDRQLP
jgi:plasmid stabilization system protein ParE